ncbi:SCAN domain-containing protein 3-like [Centruroides sculpturatus]|uniref:SCAN domain-containing protein 3-like n=1 Tax=Centruroides sculpturatus TaxID=218467 RepID=UPI000C6E1967|nr:SCAN domain-containing protein 3-like [Centruroides sculpturatus]XP_023215917.1 SCAN domain-containing protein 3-like [Centruroides sculpturatus]XP_023218036.1 SCAN domain-containing protein 3-like [Centruroides sculpturatus]XP_023222221.1 SCAN domain-containing protein 3-like [Centruroides sculpturatus]XP_023236341.1 SCAN domain-containing protein 3-like [Centruroides sculpturatus]XP_023238530.1 SCAN domain-containing protein 3-like [Centruroides sculpturatus]XP_023239061.1 SCAN domain-co
MSGTTKKKVRQYSEEYLKYGFIPAVHDERMPFCLICQQCLTNESMKLGRLEAHLKAKHKDYINSDLSFFKTLKEKFEKRTTITSIFTSRNVTNSRIQEASYQISLLIAKSGKSHTIGENLIKPSISAFMKTVLEKDDEDVKAMPLSNNTVSRRIDEMGEDIEKQLVSKLKTRNFSVQMDESTLRDSEAVLITYVRYIERGQFAEEMLFCKQLESTTKSRDIYNIFKCYLDDNEIPMKNVISCAADGAPNMMGKKNGCLQLMKADNPEMILIHCVIHKENLVAKNVSPILNEVLNAVIKCINSIKASAKTERLFKLFCEEQNEDHVRLLLHTEVRWLSKGNCLKRFIELFDSLEKFLIDKPEMKLLLTTNGKAYVSYLADIFEKLNLLNKQLQGPNKTLVDAKAKIFGFIKNLELNQKHVSNKNFEQFHWLNKCDVSDSAILEIVNHLKILITDFKERFADLKEMNFPTWMVQPVLVDLADISNLQYQEELAELQSDESVITLFNIKGAMAWLCDETEAKYPNTTKCARKLLLPFPSSYLAECGFSAVSDLLIKKRNRLDITQRGDLRLKLTKLEPDIKSLCKKHQVHKSH